MANTAIQNIKILHKRYSTNQWTNGIQINGNTIVPTLAQGEIGLDTTTFEVRIGTNSAREQNWSEARVIDASTAQSFTYYHKDGSTSTSANAAENYVATSVEIGTDRDGKHQLTVVYKSLDLIAPQQDATGSVTGVDADGEVGVVTSVSLSDVDGTHTLTGTVGKAVTKKYVDDRFSTTKTIAVEKNPTTTIPDDGSGTIEYVSAVKTSTKDHTIEYEVKELVLPSLDVNDKTETAGKYISSISVDSSDDHKIIVTKADIPTLAAGEGSGNGNGATLVGGISASGHTVTAKKKTITGSGIAVVTGTSDNIDINVDTYTKAQIDEMHNELAKAMKFAGTLGTTEGAIAALPSASTANHGNVYKVTTAGTYNGQAAKVGDLFISDGSKWRYVPSGDESFTDTWRAIKVEGTQVKSNGIGTGAIDFVAATPNVGTTDAGIVIAADGDEIQIAHADTSVVEDASRIKLEVIDGLEFDGYGHVQSYLKKKIVAGANVQLNEDEAGNLTISAADTQDTNTAHSHTVGQGLDMTGNGGIDGSVQYAHKSISTTTIPETAKTITAGSTDNKFTVVEGYTADGMGHIKEIKTREISVNIPVVEDKDTTYEISAAAKSTLAGETAANINLTAGGSGSGVDSVAIKADAKNNAPAEGLTVAVTGDEISIGGRATKDLLGLIRAAYTMTSENSAVASDGTLKTFTGNNNSKLYGVNVRTDGTAFVEVPWTDTTYTASTGLEMVGTDIRHVTSDNAANKAVDLYAFGTDAYGHINSVASVTTIDGNYA